MREQQFAVELRSSVSPLSLPLDLLIVVEGDGRAYR